jgi:hypothetical protein
VVFRLRKDVTAKCVTNSLLQQLVTCKSQTNVQYFVHCRLSCLIVGQLVLLIFLDCERKPLGLLFGFSDR